MKNIKIEKSNLKFRLRVKRARERKNLSKWNKGVYKYAEEMLDKLDDFIIEINDINDKSTIISSFGKQLLNGAQNTMNYSYGGLSLIYDGDIVERLCTPSEAKKKDYGRLRPLKGYTWLDIQARAIYQAILILKNVLNELINDEYNFYSTIEFID